MAEAGERGESFGRRAAEEMALEERDRLRHRFQVTAGLRLEREADDLARPLADPRQRGRVAQQQLGHPRGVGVPRDAGLEGAGHGAHAPVEVGLVGKQDGQELGEAVGVDEPRLVHPVGQVDLLLDPRTVKDPIREPVDREHVEPVGREESAERLELGGFGQRGGRLGGESEADAEAAVGRHFAPDGQDVALEVRAHLGPGLAGVDVGAVRQVGVAGRRELHGASRPV